MRACPYPSVDPAVCVQTAAYVTYWRNSSLHLRILTSPCLAQRLRNFSPDKATITQLLLTTLSANHNTPVFVQFICLK